MKIYTKRGDRGKTSLLSGERVFKSHKRIEAYGDVDELNSLLGAIAAVVPPESLDVIEEIHKIQSDLVHMSAWLATSPGSPSVAYLKEISTHSARALEEAIDRMEKELPPLKHFILPGGHISSALAHVARTVCRRAERHATFLDEQTSDSITSRQLDEILVFLNRLSDYLFLLARYCNKLNGVSDIEWRNI